MTRRPFCSPELRDLCHGLKKTYLGPEFKNLQQHGRCPSIFCRPVGQKQRILQAFPAPYQELNSRTGRSPEGHYLNRALDISLEGTENLMEAFAEKLKTPVTSSTQFYPDPARPCCTPACSNGCRDETKTSDLVLLTTLFFHSLQRSIQSIS